MLRINFDNNHVYVSYCGGEWHAAPLTNPWLWLIGALENGEKIDKTVAKFLLTGIITDTGGFKFSCTTNETMNIVYKLLDQSKIEL